MFGGGRDSNSYLLKATIKYDFGKHIDVIETTDISFSDPSSIIIVQGTLLSISLSQIFDFSCIADNPNISEKVELVSISFKILYFDNLIKFFC